jgi:omega-6 fatty acid desaturase (delta-12 desaturase)
MTKTSSAHREDFAVATESLAQIIRKLPRRCFAKAPGRAWGYLGRDVLMAVGFGTAIVALDSWLLAWPLAILLGCVLTGLFVIGHDAGHRSFSDSKRVNDVVGHLTTSLALWPFHVWRLSHDVHHRWTHHADREIAWRPLTVAEYAALPRWQKIIYVQSRTTFFFWASLLFQYFMVLYAVTGTFFEPKDRRRARASVALTALIGGSYAAASWWLAGAYGFALLFVVPQLVYQFWLSGFTLLHHTAPDSHLMAAEEWSPEAAQLGSSIHVSYPRLVDWLTHDISWHVPHHVCVAIPHYRLREAHLALKERYGGRVREEAISWSYVKPILAHCHLMGSTKLGGQKWLSATAVGLSRPELTASAPSAGG